MGLAVVGAGFGRTATMSLKLALEAIGFGPCYHMVEMLEHPEHIDSWNAAHQGKTVDWDDLFADYKAAVDWPSANFWRELADFYPKAKIILTIRDPERWHESVMRTIYPVSKALLRSDDPQLRRVGEWMNEVIWKQVFSDRIDNRDHALGIFNAHVKSVIQTISSDRLLVVGGKHEWKPLCNFLDCPIPEKPYPVANSAEEFLARIGADSAAS